MDGCEAVTYLAKDMTKATNADVVLGTWVRFHNEDGTETTAYPVADEGKRLGTDKGTYGLLEVSGIYVNSSFSQMRLVNGRYVLKFRTSDLMDEAWNKEEEINFHLMQGLRDFLTLNKGGVFLFDEEIRRLAVLANCEKKATHLPTEEETKSLMADGDAPF